MSLEMVAALPLAQSAFCFFPLLAAVLSLLARLALAAASSSPQMAAGESLDEPSEAARSNDSIDDPETAPDDAGALLHSTFAQDEAQVADFFDLDASFDLGSDVDSEWLRSSGLDVDWELESIASAASSASSALASLNDTDFFLGGESYDSSEEPDKELDEVDDLSLRDWGSEFVSVCSSLNDSDYILGGWACGSLDGLDVGDDVTECDSGCAILEPCDLDADLDEVDVLLTEDDAVETEPQPTAASVPATIPNSERVGRAIAKGCVRTARGSTNGNADVHASVGRKAAPRALQYEQSEASLELIKTLTEKSALAKASLFYH